MLTECTFCKKEIQRKLYRIKVAKKGNFCNTSCQSSYYWKNKLWDKNQTKAANDWVKKNGQPKLKGKPTWIKGLTKYDHSSIMKLSNTKTGVRVPKLQGSNHWNWKGGIDKGIWFTWEYKQWRKQVFERDNYTCVSCGDSKGGNLQADHIKPRYLYPELTFSLNNGRTLCENCHIKTPTYGNKVKSFIMI